MQSGGDEGWVERGERGATVLEDGRGAVVDERSVAIEGAGGGGQAEQPLVSIVTVVRNGAGVIGRAIASVSGQTYKNIQYVVIDGDSSDGTVDAIRANESVIDYWSSEKDEGISDAFNRGLRVCRGEIVGILNADDWYEPDAVERAVAGMVPGGVVYGDLRIWKGAECYVLYPREDLLTRKMTVTHPTMFVHRSVYEKYGGFSKSYKCCMDYDLCLRLKVGGVPFVYVDKVLANMTFGGTADTRWIRSSVEKLMIKRRVLGTTVRPFMEFCEQLLRNMAARGLSAMRLDVVRKMYRQRWSVMRKD